MKYNERKNEDVADICNTYKDNNIYCLNILIIGLYDKMVVGSENMDFRFILNKQYLAFFILESKMFDESKDLSEIRSKYKDSVGYKIITRQELLDVSIYIANNDINNLVNDFLSTKAFSEAYKLYGGDDKKELAIKILSKTIDNNSIHMTKTKDKLWNNHRTGYEKLLDFGIENPDVYLKSIECKKIIKEFMKTVEYKKLFKETKEYMQLVEKSWRENKNKINLFLKKLLRINYSITPNVYISHPATCKGCNFDINKIVWGHLRGKDDLNYNLAYLVHEGLHCLFPHTKKYSSHTMNIQHAIIELIADYELYSFLKGKSTIKEGHNHLAKYKNIIYPYWLNYIGLNQEAQKARAKKDKINVDFMNQNELFKKNILEFLNYCYINFVI